MTDLTAQIAIFRKEQQQNAVSSAKDNNSSSFPLCLGFIGHSAFGSEQGWRRVQHILETHRPDVVQFFAPAVGSKPDSWVDDHSFPDTIGNNIELAQSYSAKVLAQVGSFAQAEAAQQAGVDGLMVQGNEAGGHGLRRELGNGTLPLARSVVQLAERWDVPVLAGGGIVDGAGVAPVLALGCDGAVLGTRLWASHEGLGKEQYKQRLVETVSCDQVVRTTVFDQIQNAYSQTPWPQPFDSLGALRNQTSDEWDGRSQELGNVLQDESPHGKPNAFLNAYRQASKDQDADIGAVLAGQGVGLIHGIEPAHDIVCRINREVLETIQNLSKISAPRK